MGAEALLLVEASQEAPLDLPLPARASAPADGKRGACVLCHATVVVGERGAHAQEHRDLTGACIRLLWHGACAARCGWLERLADNEGLDVPPDVASATFEALHRELHQTLHRTGGATLLRAVVHVARDLPPPLTLRGPGAAWGAPTHRAGWRLPARGRA